MGENSNRISGFQRIVDMSLNGAMFFPEIVEDREQEPSKLNSLERTSLITPYYRWDLAPMDSHLTPNPKESEQKKENQTRNWRW
ncbi:unnamed protein product [Arabis nemorensis]|uniref:Uncharacterized protein n=1 Tax=Arabis nemorensis TaxID=586526 RepID=A0A565CRH0_9BRAS|nr:unnamed protein product [Arabis nemorensis]